MSQEYCLDPQPCVECGVLVTSKTHLEFSQILFEKVVCDDCIYVHEYFGRRY